MQSPPIRHLMIGDMIVTDQPAIISTVLGSCVSICLSCPKKNAGGIIHYALPSHQAQVKDPNYLRYGDYAIEALIAELKQLTGCSEKDLEAKIVGGAEAIGVHGDIGQENIKIAYQKLAEFDIKIINHDLGGKVGRKILFHLPSGRLQVATL